MILRLAIASLFARALTVGMTILAIALSVALFLGVDRDPQFPIALTKTM